jgi:hypothetical protein
MDFKKPAMFIASAEQEMQKLNPKKQQDVIKLARLRGLVNERKRTLEALQRDRIDLASELLEIARYISENLSKIADLCRSVIGALGSANTKGTEERCFLEEITTRFQEALKNAPRGGAMTPADLNSAKRDAAILSQEFAELLREDISALSGLYEAIQNHTRQAAQKIGSLVGAIEKSKGRLLEEEARTFRTIEEALVSLLTDHDFQLQVSTTRSQTLRRDILVERRSEMLDSLLQQVQQERRGRYERRSGKDRRTAGEENYQGLERRRGRDRRAGKKRRHSEYSP